MFEQSLPRRQARNRQACAHCDIHVARQWGKDYYYLGYYIAECDTMNYKTRFKPYEIKDIVGQWRQFAD